MPKNNLSLKNIVSIFGSWSKAQEILFLLQGLKDVVRHGFYDFELKAVEEFCTVNSVCLVKSKFRVVLDKSIETTGKFSNLGLNASNENDKNGMLMVYLSKDEEKAHLAAYYEHTNNQKELGLILGYPACCVDYFCQNFSASNSNPEINSDNIFTNLAHREKDCVLISHFPCRSDCPESIVLGKKNLELLQELEQKRAEKVLIILKKTNDLKNTNNFK